MDGQASPVGAVVGNVRGRADIKGLDVDERIGVGPIEAANDSVGSVPQAKAGAGQELLKGAVVARALRKDAIRARERVKASLYYRHRHLSGLIRPDGQGQHSFYRRLHRD